jgi:hypothetical protein
LIRFARTLPEMGLAKQVAIALGAFALVSAIAGLLGATNLGTALAFGQLAFVAAVSVLMIKT